MILIEIDWSALFKEYWLTSLVVLIGVLLLIIIIRYFVKKRNKLKIFSLKEKTIEQQKNAPIRVKHTTHDPYFSQKGKKQRVRIRVVTK